MFEKGQAVTPEALIEGFNGLEKTMANYDERLSKTDGSLAEIKGIVSDVKKEFEDRARREIGTGPTAKLFADHNIEEALTWDAVHKAPTDVRLKGSVRNLDVVPASHDDLVGRFQEKADQLYILAAALKLVDSDGRLKLDQVRNLKFYQREYAPARAKLADAMKKDGLQVLSTATGSGPEWDPSSFSTRLWELARLPYKLAGIIPTFTLPRSPFIFPVELADLQAYVVAESPNAPPSTTGILTDAKGSTAVTSSKTFTPVKLGAMAFASKESEEDLIVPILAYLQRKLVFALNNAKEKAILRGFKAGSGSYDSDTQGATSPGKAFNGLFHYALNVTSGTTKDAGGVNINTDALWRDHIRGARKLMDDPYKGDAGNLALVVSGGTAIDVGSCEAFRTAYAMGGMSSNRNGDSTGFSPDGLGSFVISPFMRTDLASTGVNSGTPANDVYTAAIQFYPEAWLLGEERAVRIEVLRERYAEFDVDAVKITYRADLQYMLSGKHTVATIDILP